MKKLAFLILIFFDFIMLPSCKSPDFDDAPCFFVVYNHTQYPVLIEINTTQSSKYLPTIHYVLKPVIEDKIHETYKGALPYLVSKSKNYPDDTLAEYYVYPNAILNEKAIHSINVYQSKNNSTIRANCDFALFKYWKYVPDQVKFEHRLELHVKQEHFN